MSARYATTFNFAELSFAITDTHAFIFYDTIKQTNKKNQNNIEQFFPVFSKRLSFIEFCAGACLGGRPPLPFR